MRCLRCGWCCKHSAVVVVDDPDLGPVEGNLIFVPGDGIPCKHLTGDTPGEYACAVHDREWYKETPCFAHGQIENSPDDPCRMGKYILSGEKSAKA